MTTVRRATWGVLALVLGAAALVATWPDGCRVGANCGIEPVNAVLCAGLALVAVVAIGLGVETALARRKRPRQP